MEYIGNLCTSSSIKIALKEEVLNKKRHTRGKRNNEMGKSSLGPKRIMIFNGTFFEELVYRKTMLRGQMWESKREGNSDSVSREAVIAGFDW